MCSMMEDDQLCETRIQLKPEGSAVCRKCSSKKVVILLQKKFSYCRSCFLTFVTHKFRACIGKLKLNELRDSVLLIFFGNMPSLVLLHLIVKGLNEESHKKIRLPVKILFIDDSILWPENVNKLSLLSEIRLLLEKYQLPCFVTKLSSIYECVTIDKLHEDYLSRVSQFDENDDKIVRLFSGIKSCSSKIELLSLLRYRLCHQAANALDCNRIFLPECATSIAVGLMCDTIFGRSSRIPHDTAVCDKRNSVVSIIRPLKEITVKELTFFSVFNKIQFSIVPSLYSVFHDEISLQSETLSFIVGLQENFPSTVNTVFRIGDKLNKTDNSVSAQCSLCLTSIPTFTIENNLPYRGSILCRPCKSVINDIDSINIFPVNLMRADNPTKF